MKVLLAAAAASLLSLPAAAGGEAAVAAAASGWRDALAREYGRAWGDPAELERIAREAESRARPAPSVSEEDAVRWDFEDGEKTLTMTLSRKTLSRHAEYYRRWNEDPSLRLKYRDDDAAYLGKVNGRVAVAIIDAIVTPLDRAGAVEPLYLSPALVRFLVEALEVAERVDSGQFDLYGTDVDDFFRDRMRSRASGGVAVPAASTTRRKLRVRVRPHSNLEATKVALVASAEPDYAPFRRWRFELGLEARPLDGKEITRGWVGATRPWPER